MIIEGRESLFAANIKDANSYLHSINRFIRSDEGSSTLFVWPCNDQGLIDSLVTYANSIGGTSLISRTEPYYYFAGPDKGEFFGIIKRTTEFLNSGRTLIDYGITDQRAMDLIGNADSIGDYINIISSEIRKNENYVNSLVQNNQCKMWVVVLAGNEPIKDVSALTKGGYLTADIDRMILSTDANIVNELKQYPDKIGLLANFFDCRIICMPIVTINSVIRDYKNSKLEQLLYSIGFKTAGDGSGSERITNCELGKMLNSTVMNKGRKGKTGDMSIEAFRKLAQIARTNDALLNEALGQALLDSKLIDNYTIESDFGNGLKRRTDLVCSSALGEVRLECMWRDYTSQADIANYTLTKLYNYGRALDFFS